MAEIRTFPGWTYFDPTLDEVRHFRGIIIDVAGVVVITDGDDVQHTWNNLAVGVPLGIGGKSVDTGTTATLKCIAK